MRKITIIFLSICLSLSMAFTAFAGELDGAAYVAVEEASVEDVTEEAVSEEVPDLMEETTEETSEDETEETSEKASEEASEEIAETETEEEVEVVTEEAEVEISEDEITEETSADEAAEEETAEVIIIEEETFAEAFAEEETSEEEMDEEEILNILLNATQINTELVIGKTKNVAQAAGISSVASRLTWKSSDSTVVSVDYKGVATAKKYGKVEISAYYYGTKYVSCTIQTRFKDVTNSSSAFYTAIYWAADKGIVGGMSDGTFGEGKSCTRKQFVIMLYRYSGKPSVSGSMKFSDCKKYGSTSDTYKAILWASQKGIIKGYDDGTFRPDATVTRKQTMIMLYRYVGKPAVSGTMKFSDCKYGKTSDSYKAILWGVKYKITGGTNGGKTFSPDASCLRRQIVLFLYRLYNTPDAYKGDGSGTTDLNSKAKAAYKSLLQSKSTAVKAADSKTGYNFSVYFEDFDNNGVIDMMYAYQEDSWNYYAEIVTYNGSGVVSMLAEPFWVGFGMNGARYSFFKQQNDNAIYVKGAAASGGMGFDVIDKYVFKNGKLVYDKTVASVSYERVTSTAIRYSYVVNGQASTKAAVYQAFAQVDKNMARVLLGGFQFCLSNSDYSFAGSKKDYSGYYVAMSYNAAITYLSK